MAYQQASNSYPQQQYYNQAPPSQGRQPAGYDNQQYNGQYDDYGYEQGQYDQWNDGAYNQPQQSGWDDGNMNGQRPPPRQQYQSANDGMNGQMRAPPQGRPAPPPGPQYGQEPMNNNGGGRAQRANSRGNGNGRPPNLEQGQPGLKPPSGRGRALMSPVSPMELPQDNPFPSFPSQKAKPKPTRDPLDEAMNLMSLGPGQGEQPIPPQGRQPGPQRIQPGAPQGRQPGPRGMGPGSQRMQPGPPQGRQPGPPQGRQFGPPQGMQQGPPRMQSVPPQGMQPAPPQGRARGQGPPPQQRGPPGRGQGYAPDPRQGYGPDPRQDSGHFEGNAYGQQQYPPAQGYGQQKMPPMNPEASRALPPQRQDIDQAPPQPSFEPSLQRSKTMPQTMNPSRNEMSYDPPHQWTEPGPVAGYHGPESPTYIPQRPSTAGGTRQNGPVQAPPPPLPQQPYTQQYPQQAHQNEQDFDSFYDDYYGDDTAPPAQGSRQSQVSIDMPNFDAIQEPNGRHRRGFSIENHLSPTSGVPPATQAMAGLSNVSPLPAQDFHQQAARSRSQPDLHGQYQQGGVFEMAGDVPAVPQLPRANTGFAASNGLPTGPRGRGVPGGAFPNAMTGRGAPPGQGYPGGQPQNFDPRLGRQQPPAQRGYSDQSLWSDPGLQDMRNGPPMAGTPIQRPGTAAPLPTRKPSDPIRHRPGTTQSMRNSNPDALPPHPVPVRPGLLQQQEAAPSPQAARPPPARQYNTDPGPAGYSNQQVARAPSQRQKDVDHPVTHDELNRLRNTWKFNQGDSAAGLMLAKKLVEAATVLADEGGTADSRSRNKNRERFILEAHKTVKKLVAGGSADAMFYLADCYGQGQLGLQVDTKEAFTLYQSAAKAGHAASAYRTAVCCEMGHEEGGGTKKDPLKAVQWYRRAAALGDVPAMYKTGMILLKGLLGQQKNLSEAINMLKRAADRADEQNPHALHELALLYEAQTGNERIIRDEAYAFSLFKQASELGYKFSQFRLGQAYEYGLLGCPVDPRGSIAWYSRAAAQEEHQSELALSGWYLTGSKDILEQSDMEAYLWARKAATAEPPLPKALFAMGHYSETGIGCTQSLEEAKRWYSRAAAYKLPQAITRIEELKRGGPQVQKTRGERLSRSNQKHHDENCTVM